MKKYLASLAAAALTLSLVSCGNCIGENSELTTKHTVTSVPLETEVPPAETSVPTTETITETTTEITEPVPETTVSTVLPLEEMMPSYGEWAKNTIIIADRYEGDKVRALLSFYSTESIGQTYAEMINRYKEMVGSSVNVYNMSVPLASAFYMPPDMADAYDDQSQAIKDLGKYLSSDVTNVDLIDVLNKHLAEYIYSRTDHHWQPLGAYYAAQYFCQLAGVPSAPLDSYEQCKIEGFGGTMNYFSGYVKELGDHPDTFYYYKPANDYTVTYYDSWFSNGVVDDLFYDWVSGDGCYSAIMGGDRNITEIKTDVGNGRCLVLIKDSYGNALVPFFVGSFEKIYVVDFRYVDISMKELFERIGVTDVLFGMSVSSGYTPGQIQLMSDMME